MTHTSDRNSVTTSLTEPSTPRLQLQTPASSSYGLLDGGWWPRSTNPVAELPGLILAIDELHGPITRILLHRNDWTHHPRRLGLAGRVIRLGYFASHPTALLTAFIGPFTGLRVDLLIVPPDTQLEIAGAAMTLAATRGNHIRAQHVLDKVIKVTVPAPIDVRSPVNAWENEGGGQLTTTNQPTRPLS